MACAGVVVSLLFFNVAGIRLAQSMTYTLMYANTHHGITRIEWILNEIN